MSDYFDNFSPFRPKPFKFDPVVPILPKYDLPKIELPKYEIPKYEPPKPDPYYDRNEWNRLYGYHHTLGPAFGPKFLG